MKPIQPILFSVAALLAIAVTSSTASANTYLSPFNDAAVEMRVVFVVHPLLGGHYIFWTRLSDGACRKAALSKGGHDIFTGPGNDSIIIQRVNENISCDGLTLFVTPPLVSAHSLHIYGGAGADTFLIKPPVRAAFGGPGNDVMIVLETPPNYQNVMDVIGDDGDDDIESWETNKTIALINGHKGNDCIWVAGVNNWFAGGEGWDRGNRTHADPNICEEFVPCCPVGAFIGACRP